MENELSNALINSISGNICTITTNIAEISLDSILKDGLLKDFPIVSTVVSLYKIGSSIKDRHDIRNLAAFVLAFNNGITDDEKKEHYKSVINSDQKQRNRELEYILILLDRYIHYDKAEMLAKLYLAYLDGKIDWTTLAKAAEVLDRLLPSDYPELLNQCWPDLDDSDVPDSLLRLISLGLVISHSKGATVNNTVGSIVLPAEKKKDYELTGFGKTLLQYLSE